MVAASGTATIVTLRARPKKRFLTGSPKTHRFQTVIQPKEAAPVNVDGSMVQLPMLPKWLPKALAALVALVVVAAVLWFTLLDPTIKSTATQATNQALSAAGIPPGGGGSHGGGGSPSPSSSGTTVTPTPASSQGGPASGRLAVKVNAGGNSGCPGGNAGRFTIPAGQVFSLTDLVFQNPNGDTGTLTLSRQCGGVLFQEQLSNFRDLDFHFVNAITFAGGQSMILQVACAAPGPPAPSPPGTACSDGMVYAGFLKPGS